MPSRPTARAPEIRVPPIGFLTLPCAILNPNADVPCAQSNKRCANGYRFNSRQKQKVAFSKSKKSLQRIAKRIIVDDEKRRRTFSHFPFSLAFFLKPKSSQTLIDKGLERVKGIEPSYAAWEAAVLPLNYTRSCGLLVGSNQPAILGVGAKGPGIWQSIARKARPFF